jgi:hypothetical protein
LQFRNNGTAPLNGNIKVADYVIADKIGTPVLVEDGQMSLKYAAAKWITPLNTQITVPSNDYVAVNIAVNPPQEIGACGHYAIVYFEPFEGNLSGAANAQTKSESSVINKIGALINLRTASQNCKQDMSVLSFTTPSFLEYGPIPVDFDLFNKGDVHIVPVGSVSINNVINAQVGITAIKEQRIFPETAKSYEVVVGQKYMIGRYLVTLQGTYGDSNLPFSKTSYVWVFPWKIAVVVLLALLILIIGGVNMFKGIAHKEASLEQELEDERKEIDKLKKELKHRD